MCENLWGLRSQLLWFHLHLHFHKATDFSSLFFLFQTCLMPIVLTNLLPRDEDEPVRSHHGKPVVAFIIGLSIVLLASILNAAGLNLTKLDHVSLYTCSEL